MGSEPPFSAPQSRAAGGAQEVAPILSPISAIDPILARGTRRQKRRASIPGGEDRVQVEAQPGRIKAHIARAMQSGGKAAPLRTRVMDHGPAL